MSTRSDGGAEPGGDGGDEDEGTSGNVVVRELVLAEAEEGIDIRKGDEGCRGCRGGWSWASCAPARARSTRVIEFLSKTRLRSVSPSRGRSEGEVAVWSLRRERFESQAVVSMLWNMDGTREWFSGDGKVGSGKMGGAVTELPSVVGSVSVVEDVLNDDGVWWAVAVDDEDEGQAPEVDVGSWGGLLIEPGRRIEAGASGQRGKAGGERGPGSSDETEGICRQLWAYRGYVEDDDKDKDNVLCSTTLLVARAATGVKGGRDGPRGGKTRQNEAPLTLGSVICFLAA